MDRLTEWNADHTHGCCVKGDGYTRLAQYEDTGLSPEEIVTLRDKRGGGIPIDKTGRCHVCGRKMTLEELQAFDIPSIHAHKPRCPICGERCTKIFRAGRYGDILGCDQCITVLDAGEDEAALPDDYLNDKTLERLWDDFGSVLINPATETLITGFRDFSPGTRREEVYRWFDENHSKGVHYLMTEYRREEHE